MRFSERNDMADQALLAELFQKDVRTVNEHLQNIYEEGEVNIRQRCGHLAKMQAKSTFPTGSANIYRVKFGQRQLIGNSGSFESIENARFRTKLNTTTCRPFLPSGTESVAIAAPNSVNGRPCGSRNIWIHGVFLSRICRCERHVRGTC